MLIYFLRHGLAGNRTEWKEDDRERPLTDQGKKKMRREAKRLQDLVDFDLIITSPLVRARQTAEIVAKRLGLKDQLVVDERLAPGFGMDCLTEIVKEHPAQALMLVGHEPDFSETVCQLTGGGRLVLKKGGIACVEVQDGSMQGDLLWLVTPKLLLG